MSSLFGPAPNIVHYHVIVPSSALSDQANMRQPSRTEAAAYLWRVGFNKQCDQLSLPSPNEGACTRPHNTLLPLRWSDATVGFLLGSERRVQVLTDALQANDLKWISGYVSIREPPTPPLWWHQDWWCVDHPATYQPTAP